MNQVKRTLLLVDDEKEITSALLRLLRGDGYTILQAHSGQEGLELLSKNLVGVIISDQRMPEMSGVEFLTQAKALYPKTIRIILSGYADLDAIKNAINFGAIYKYLSKPWDNESLSVCVRDAFHHYEMVQEEEHLAQEIEIAKDELARTNQELAVLLKRKNNQIEHISHFDPLTNLPNRVLFHDRLEQALTVARRDDCQVGVMFVNLSRFKHINDSLGHPIGDQLLQAVAQRLENYGRLGDTVARIGGDEFAFVLSNMKDAHEADDVAQKILDSLAHEPMVIGESEIYASASIGMSIFPMDGSDALTLIKNTDAALHHAKSEGGNNFQYYAAQMNAKACQRLTLETELRHALEREEFTLFYQPKVELLHGKIVGVEALLRWNNTERGMVLPGDFIPLLEETGLILPVGEWVLRAACKQACAWQAQGYADIRIAVNLSALQFRQPDLADVILNILKEYGLDSSLEPLELELTESLLMKSVNQTITTLNKLRDRGIVFSIDDFGTGYSSLSYLTRFPISSLKIDQSFVRDLVSHSDDASIVSAVIALGHSLGMNVIAEGVETKEQMHYLRKMKCDEMQGYLFSRPVPAAEMTRLLEIGKCLDLFTEA